MVYQILAERPNTLLVFENNKLKTYSKDEYNMLKLKQFNGERIYHIAKPNDQSFGDEIEYHETFTRGVFNVKYKGETLQLREPIKIALAIRESIESNKHGRLVEMFMDKYKQEHKEEIMFALAKNFGDRVKYANGEFIIDDMFMVNGLGSAHKRIPSGGWSGICIVADTKQCSIPIKTKLGVVMLSQTEVEILSKIGFLLYPDMNDTVFTGQLTLKEREISKNKNKEVSK